MSVTADKIGVHEGLGSHKLVYCLLLCFVSVPIDELGIYDGFGLVKEIVSPG